jgi:hypothetical protein
VPVGCFAAAVMRQLRPPPSPRRAFQVPEGRTRDGLSSGLLGWGGSGRHRPIFPQHLAVFGNLENVRSWAARLAQAACLIRTELVGEADIEVRPTSGPVRAPFWPFTAFDDMLESRGSFRSSDLDRDEAVLRSSGRLSQHLIKEDQGQVEKALSRVAR